MYKGGMYEMELVLDKKTIVSEEGKVPEAYYIKEEDHAATMIALAVMRDLFENNLLTKDEYEFVQNKYML